MRAVFNAWSCGALPLLALMACDSQLAQKQAAQKQAAKAAASVSPSATATVEPERDAGPASPGLSISRERRFDVEDDGWLSRADTADIDGRRVDHLLQAAERTESDALIVIRNGAVIIERAFDQPRDPMETRSITKSVAALAILALVDDGEIASIDVPLSTFFPAFEEGRKAQVTLRHVLTHTTGLEHGLDGEEGLNAQDDRLSYVKARPVKSPPGQRYAYNNEATQLLAGVVEACADVPLDVYVQKRLFDPIGIGSAKWAHDRSGGVQSYYGLRLTARDLARLGLFLLAKGKVEDRQVLSEKAVASLASPSERNLSYGLLFWRRSDLFQAIEGEGVPFAKELRGFDGRLFRTEGEYFEAVNEQLGPSGTNTLSHFHQISTKVLRETRPIGVYAVGGLGQRLAVYPEASMVAVRQHRRRPGDDKREKEVAYGDFFDHVEALDARIARKEGR